jgi:condensin complex subunit 3
VVQYGLGDREGSVRKATAAMLGGWVDQAGGDLVEVGLFILVSRKVLMTVFEPLRCGFE